MIPGMVCGILCGMPRRSASGSSPGQGYFPRGSSLLRQVHEEHLVGLLYGQRALCIGALAPLNYIGTSEHSYAKLTPFKRLVHTGKAFERIYFGTRAEADRVLAYVDKLHQQVNGDLAEDAGPGPGRHALRRVRPRADAVDGGGDRRLGAVLLRAAGAPAERCRSARRCGRTTSASPSCSGCRARRRPPPIRSSAPGIADKLASDEMYLTEEARYIGYATAFEIPMPWYQQPGKRVHDLLMLGSLPRRVRELYELAYTRAPADGLRRHGPRDPRRAAGHARRRWPAAGTRARSTAWRGPSAGGSSTAARRPRCATRARSGSDRALQCQACPTGPEPALAVRAARRRPDSCRSRLGGPVVVS